MPFGELAEDALAFGVTVSVEPIGVDRLFEMVVAAQLVAREAEADNARHLTRVAHVVGDVVAVETEHTQAARRQMVGGRAAQRTHPGKNDAILVHQSGYRSGAAAMTTDAAGS